jgi:O-antigen ligase
MKVRLNDFKRLYLLVALLSYLGVLNFISLAMSGGKADDALSSFAAGSLLKQIVGSSLFLASILLLYKSSGFSLKNAIKQSFWWIVLIGYFVISIYWSYAPQITFRRIIAFSTLVIVTYCLVEFFTVRSLLSLLVTAIGLMAIAGLIYAIVQPDKAFISSGLRSSAFKGVYYDKNGGARIYSYAILLAMGLELYKTVFQKLLLTALVICIVLSQSATALVMIFFGLTLTFAFKLMHTSNANLNLWRFLFLLLGLIVGSALVFYLYDFILGLLGRDPTLTNRVIIWELMDQYVRDEWLFGYGFGAFWSSSAVASFVERWGFIGNSHSGYYEALLHGGIICLGLVFIIIIQSLIRFVKLYIYSENGDVVSMLLPVILIQCVVNYVGDLVINHNSFDMFMFVLVFFIASKGVVNRDKKQS